MKNYLERVKEPLKREPDPAFARRARIIFENLPLSAGSRVLDIGCGRGFYLKTLSLLDLNLDIYGVDLNQEYLKKASRILKDKKIHLVESDAAKLPFQGNYFDSVIASEILEHIPDDGKALVEIYRVLKPGGKAVITVPNRNYPFLWDPLNWILERFFKVHIPANIWWLAGIWADHKRLYLAKELKDKLRKAGFEIEKEWQTTFHCFPFSHFLFYGIGKNLVEKGFFASCNRFAESYHPSLISQILLWPIKAVDKLNRGRPGKRSVNLIFAVEKAPASSRF